MSLQRLETALSTGAFDWPEGPVLALRPHPGTRGFPQGRTLIAHGFRPAHDAWRDAGWDSVPRAVGRFSSAYIALPRARDHAHLLLARALELVVPGGLIVVDGAKTDGVEPVRKLCRGAFDETGVLSKAHGKIFWFERPDLLPRTCAEWGRPAPSPAGWHVAPGVFSADGVDPGSALLAQNLPALSGRVADLGAGWGYLSAQALGGSPDIAAIDLVEAEHAALEAARRNVDDPRAKFHWADALAFSEQGYDAVIMNPPFHRARKADPGLGQAFVRAAARMLARHGRLWLVANRHLPYEAALSECFADTQEIAQAEGFKILMACKPRPAAQAAR